MFYYVYAVYVEQNTCIKSVRVAYFVQIHREWMNMKLSRLIRLLVAVAVMSVFMVIGGCGDADDEDVKVKDLEFTVLKESEIPKDIMELIEQKKSQEFKVTKTSEPYTYIIVGYGKQKTGGYSIQVEDLYLGEKAVYVDTELLGPVKGETVKEEASYPYIVIKLEQREEPIVFE